jgi:hypothetical protein
MLACVAEQQRHLTVNQADLIVLRGCESYHMHQEFFWGRRLTANHRTPNPRFSVQIRASQPNLEGGARWRATGLENQAEQCVSRVRLLHLPPKSRRRRLTVWQRFAKSPRIACAGSTPAASAKVSVVISSDSTGGCQRSSLTSGKFRTCSSAE